MAKILTANHRPDQEGRVLYGHDRVLDIPIWMTELELEIIEHPHFQRLKGVSHAGTFIKRSSHSRYEHSIGVYAIIANLFPSLDIRDKTMRAAALLHDIGHTAYSHSLESAVKKHHEMTRGTAQGGIKHHEMKAISLISNTDEGGLGSVLLKHGLDPQMIVDIATVQIPSPLKGFKKGEELGADHLDSYLRDTVYAVENGLTTGNLSKMLKENRKIIESLNLRNRDTRTSLDISEKPITDLVINTNLKVAASLVSRERTQHEIIYDDRGIAMDFASSALFFLAITRGIIKPADFFKADAEIERKLTEVSHRTRHKIIHELGDLVFGAIQENDTSRFEVQKESTAPNYKLKSVYDYVPLVKGVPFTALKDNVNQQKREKILQAEKDLKWMRSRKGKYQVLLDVSPDVLPELDIFNLPAPGGKPTG